MGQATDDLTPLGMRIEIRIVGNGMARGLEGLADTVKAAQRETDTAEFLTSTAPMSQRPLRVTPR